MPTAAPDGRRCGRPPRTRDSTTAHTRARTSKGTAAMRIAVGSDHAGFHLKDHVNVVALSGSRLGPREADAIVAAFLRTEFEGGRHARRVGQITAIEEGRQ